MAEPTTRPDIVEQAAKVFHAAEAAKHFEIDQAQYECGNNRHPAVLETWGDLDPSEREIYEIAARALADAGLLADPEQRAELLEIARTCTGHPDRRHPQVPSHPELIQQARAERDLALWLHAEAAWRVAGFDVLTVKLAQINQQLQARIDAALAALAEPTPHLRRTDPGLMSMNARRNHEQLAQRLRAALQGDQPEVPGG